MCDAILLNKTPGQYVPNGENYRLAHVRSHPSDDTGYADENLPMELDKILEALKRDRDSLDEAIVALERLLPGAAKTPDGEQGSKRAGRPARARASSE